MPSIGRPWVLTRIYSQEHTAMLKEIVNQMKKKVFMALPAQKVPNPSHRTWVQSSVQHLLIIPLFAAATH